MVNTNSVLSSILFSQTIDWNIKQFFSSTSINSSFELKRIGKAITRRKDQMVVEDDKRYKRITIKTNCGGVFVRDEVLGKDKIPMPEADVQKDLIRKYNTQLAEAKKDQDSIDNLQYQIEQYILKKLGISFKRSSFNGLIGTTYYKNLTRWDPTYLSNKIIINSNEKMIDMAAVIAHFMVDTSGKRLRINTKEDPDKKFAYIGMEHVEKNTGKVFMQQISGKDILSQTVRVPYDYIIYGKLRPYLNKYWENRSATKNVVCSSEFFVFDTKNMNTQKLNSAIAEFTKKKKSNAAYYEENWAERKERKEYYQSFTKDKLLAMTEEEFLEYISKLWSMLIWGNKKYVVDKMIADNGFAMLKKQLAELLYSTNPIEKRWDVFLKSIKGMGPATISELLTYANPQEYVIFNKTTILCYGYLDIPDMPKYNYQYTGKKYAEVCAIAKKIAAELKKAGADDYDLLAVDYFMWDEILPLAEKKSPVSPATPEVKKPVTVKDSKSLHDEIKEKLVAIGELLGFDSRSEVKITTGAVVDAVWEAKIGNMGKAIYVFEVQSKGSIDSLILNLKKAQSNAAVQAVVAVADEEQLAKIIRESAGVIDEKSLRTWDSEDVLAVYDSLVRAHESINKLALVPESF